MKYFFCKFKVNVIVGVCYKIGLKYYNGKVVDI